jgi:hypothetical protein
VFRRLYALTIILIVLAAVAGTVVGAITTQDDDKLISSALAAFLVLIFAAQPLYLVFFALNVWGYVRYPTRRWRYALVTVILVAWMVWTIHKVVTMPLP